MINRYYQQQLSYLRELGIEFSRKHPALAPMLAGQNADPDVERLLEGTAFLSGMVQERLDDDFPEIIHGLTELLFPHYLRPLPAATMIQFRPKPGLKEPLTIRAGVELASVERDGQSCTFTTCGDVELLPLSLESVVTRNDRVRLSFNLQGMPLESWQSDSLRLFLRGNYSEAVERFSTLSRHLKGVRLHAGGRSVRLSAEQGFRVMPEDDGMPLFPYPSNAFRAFLSVQEYFLLPQKFLFFELRGLSWLRQFGELGSFEVELELGTDSLELHGGHLALFCVPAVNLFSHHADSILLDHRLPEYRVSPSGGRATRSIRWSGSPVLSRARPGRGSIGPLRCLIPRRSRCRSTHCGVASRPWAAARISFCR